MVLTAFKSPVYVYSYTIWFPPTLENFREVFNERWGIRDKIINSTIIAVSTVSIAIPIAVCSAYAFSRLTFPLKRSMFQWILLTQFIPAVTIVLPFYVMFRQLGLLDTYAALIIVDLAIVLPYAIWTIKGFIDAIPMETEEAAIVDGASRARIIWDIVVPMARPGILTAAIFCFIITWNEFLFGYLLSRQRVVPLSVGIVELRAGARARMGADRRDRNHHHDPDVLLRADDSTAFHQGHEPRRRALNDSRERLCPAYGSRVSASDGEPSSACVTSTSSSTTRSSSCSSVLRDAARRRPCAWWPGSRNRPTGRSGSATIS